MGLSSSQTGTSLDAPGHTSGHTGVKTDDWVVLKAEQIMKSNQPFLLLINEECLTQLEENDHRLWYGVRKAKIKVFRNEPPDNTLEEVDDTSGLLNDLLLEEKSAVGTDTGKTTNTTQ